MKMELIQNLIKENLTSSYNKLKTNKISKNEFLNNLQIQIHEDLKLGTLQEKKYTYEIIYLLIFEKFFFNNFNFQILELMISSEIELKRLGYSLALKTFEKDTDAQLMSINLIKRDLNNKEILHNFLALEYIGKFFTLDILATCEKEIVGLATVIKKEFNLTARAILILEKGVNSDIISQDCLKKISLFLNKKSDVSILSASIKLFSSLGKKNIKWLFFVIMKLSDLLEIDNKWVLLKVLKLFEFIFEEDSRISLKLVNKIYFIFSMNESKSIDLVLIKMCLKYFFFEKKILELILSKIDDYLFSDDINLSLEILGCLKEVFLKDNLDKEIKKNILKKIENFFNDKKDNINIVLFLESFDIFLISYDSKSESQTQYFYVQQLLFQIKKANFSENINSILDLLLIFLSKEKIMNNLKKKEINNYLNTLFDIFNYLEKEFYEKFILIMIKTFDYNQKNLNYLLKKYITVNSEFITEKNKKLFLFFIESFSQLDSLENEKDEIFKNYFIIIENHDLEKLSIKNKYKFFNNFQKFCEKNNLDSNSLEEYNFDLIENFSSIFDVFPLFIKNFINKEKKSDKNLMEFVNSFDLSLLGEIK